MTQQRKGKIARLPLPIRDEVCRRLYEGHSAPVILAWLNACPEAIAVLERESFGGVETSREFNDGNLSEWRAGGYQDWLRDEERMDAIRNRSELAMRMARAAGGSVAESIIARIAGKLDETMDVLSEEDLAKLSPLLTVLAQFEKLKMDRRRADQKDDEIKLSRQRFARETTELFLQWFEDQRAREIAASPATNSDKIERLGQLMFGDDWK